MMYRFLICFIFFSSLGVFGGKALKERQPSKETILESDLNTYRIKLKNTVNDSREKWRSLRFLWDNKDDEAVRGYCQSHHLSIEAIYPMAEAYRALENAASAVIMSLFLNGCPKCKDTEGDATSQVQREKKKTLEHLKNTLKGAKKDVSSQKNIIGQERIDSILGDVYVPTYLYARPAEIFPAYFPPEHEWSREAWPHSIFGVDFFVRTPSWREDERNKVPSVLERLIEA